MQKILDLTNEVLRSGRVRSKFMPGGIWDSAQGLNPYLENDDYRGTMAVTAAPTDLTGSVVVDNPIAYAKNEQGSTYNLYVMGDAGHLYSLNPTGTSVVDRRSATPMSSPANGMAVFKPRAASSATLLYALNGGIGTWDMASTYPTGWNDNTYSLSSTATPHRPMHPLFDRVYYGNKNFVGQFSDDGTSTIAHDAQVLDLDGAETVTALSDDGRYLIIATSRTVQESYNGASRVRVLFWDTNSNSWDWEAPIPNEFSIRGMVRVGDVTYAVGKRGLYTVAFGVAPKLVYAFDSDETIAFDATSFGAVQSIGAFGDGVMFGKLGTVVSEFLPGTNRAVYNPLQGFTGDIGLTIPDFLENKIFIGTRSAKLYSFDMTAAGNGGGSSSFITRFFDLGAVYDVSRLKITLPNSAAGTISIAVAGTDNTFTVPLVISGAKYPGSRFLDLQLPRSVTGQLVRLSIAMTSGAPSFSSLSLWGTPAS